LGRLFCKRLVDPHRKCLGVIRLIWFDEGVFRMG
jgi:hypothetical protein